MARLLNVYRWADCYGRTHQGSTIRRLWAHRHVSAPVPLAFPYRNCLSPCSKAAACTESMRSRAGPSKGRRAADTCQKANRQCSENVTRGNEAARTTRTRFSRFKIIRIAPDDTTAGSSELQQTSINSLKHREQLGVRASCRSDVLLAGTSHRLSVSFCQGTSLYQDVVEC